MKVRLKKKQAFAIIAVILVVSIAVAAIILTHSANKSADPVITRSTDTPSEVAPQKDTYKWSGGADDPKYITLPTISAEGFIQKAGIDQNNQIAVPSNIHMAAWFNKSAQPGKPGLSIIDGHVNGRVNDGIFKNLNDLKIGDIYEIELGNGSKKNFKVIKKDTVITADSVNILFSQDPTVSSQLNLITCAGSFDAKLQSYDKRLIVSSAFQN